jgi:hypothetical protein
MSSNDTSMMMVVMSGGMGCVAMLVMAMVVLFVANKTSGTSTSSPSSSKSTSSPAPANQRGKPKKTAAAAAAKKKASTKLATTNSVMPSVTWPVFEKLVMIGETLKTVPYSVDQCKAECHKLQKCTHFEGHVDAKGQKVCVLKSIDIPVGCEFLRERCSDGFSSSVDFLYAHPDRDAATKGYAKKLFDGTKAKI